VNSPELKHSGISNLFKLHVLQCVAVCCSVLQCDAVCSRVLHCFAEGVLESILSNRSMFYAKCTRLLCCSVLQFVAVCSSVLQCVAVHCRVCT